MTDSVENTPGRMAIEVMESVHKELVFKKPSGIPKKRKMKILEEETYVEQIGNIIQRDFFPDLEKITAQNEYLDALQRNDTQRIRELYMKYNEKKLPTERMPSPATFETPSSIHPIQDDIPLLNNPLSNNDNEQPQQTDNVKVKSLSLDQYLNSHTSQDNESFEEILENNVKKLREKYKYLYGIEDSSDENQMKMLALPSIGQQAALPEKPFNLNMWGYRNKNFLMYNPEGQELTKEEELRVIKNKQEINYENTRLKVNPFNEVRSKATINELAKNQAKVLDGKIGVDGKELIKPETPKIGGFSLVRTPSPSPSILGSPLMTWGEIEGTPFRLDGSDTPIPKSQGRSFKISEPPRREQIAFALAEKVGEKNRSQKKKALDAQRRQLSSPSPHVHSSTLERLATMSPAVRKLASSHLGITVSRSPSPRTPKLGLIPKSPLVKRLVTPKRVLDVQKIEEQEVSTDNLLKISLPDRKKAADFF